MNARETLRGKLGRFTTLTILLVGVSAVALIAAQSYLSLKSKRSTVAEDLTRSSRLQNDLLIPTFILPEQERGQSLVLKKIVQEDGLELAKIATREEDIPAVFSKCVLSPKGSSCLNEPKDRLATITPITDAGQTFGYLIKVKRLDAAASYEQSIFMMGSVGIVLIVTFALLLWGMNRISSREVPKELEALVRWVEEYLSEKGGSLAPNLKFREFNDLGHKISELVDRHDQAQDQAVIGQFVGGIMHDIRTPLQSVVTALELVRENSDDEKARRELLENLYQVCRVKLPLIGQIIETTLDGGRAIHVDKQVYDLNETIQEATSLHHDFAKRRKATIKIVAPQSPVLAAYDPVQLIRVVGNLVKNGIEATSESSLPAEVRVGLAATNDNRVSVWVEDSGAGISIHHDRLFRLFRSKKRHGSGLGLLISKKIVEAHGGELRVDKSETLGGARFEIGFPDGLAHQSHDEQMGVIV